jgi:cell division protein ZapE
VSNTTEPTDYPAGNSAAGNAAGPLARYQEAIAQGIIHEDDAQLSAVKDLQRLFDSLCKPLPRRSVLGRLFDLGGGSSSGQRAQLQGLYFWGGVGRGKTYLMDLFYESLPFADKRRMHFHRFMRHVHQSLTRLQGQANPLQKVASDLAASVRVLCFDEFFVSDITDAMILAGLLEALFDLRVTLVATSNIEPRHLYENGLQRSKFLPAIDLLEKHMLIRNVDGGIDYRLRALENAEIYHSPLEPSADAGLAQSFGAISPDLGETDVILQIEGRPIRSRMCGDGVVWFEFAELCEGPRSQNDYIELAMIYQTVLVSNIPELGPKKDDAARRFISLVDEFYDRNVKLILSAERPIDDLYQGERLVFEYQRTRSRLQEMQSHDYLAREHRP